MCCLLWPVTSWLVEVRESNAGTTVVETILDITSPCGELRENVTAFAKNRGLDHGVDAMVERITKGREFWPVRGQGLEDARLHRVGARKGEVVAMLRRQNLMVIDVGGAMGTWAAQVVDAYLDREAPPAEGKKQFFRVRTVNDADEWTEVREYVKNFGKFDFAICTHFLEDISTPSVVVKMLPLIAKAGYIATPSKYWEFSRACGTPFRGHIHHRWIFSIVGNRWTAFPKQSFLEYSSDFDTALYDEYHPDSCWDHPAAELSFFWSQNLSLHLANDDFLGPTTDNVLQTYGALLDDDTTAALRPCQPK